MLFSEEVRNALSSPKPILALESTIVAHGMPYPQNLEFAVEAENLVRENGATPATIAILDGKVHVGLESDELERIASDKDVKKLATRDLAGALAHGETGATTVSATMILAHRAGVQVFATGGIGGVHRMLEFSGDISADLNELGRVPIIVISAGAKAILDLPSTLEALETVSVPVVGYRCNEFPAFYSRNSGLPIPRRVDSIYEITRMYRAHLELGLESALLVANPVPGSDEIRADEMEAHIERAIDAANRSGITGKEVTPFLLRYIVDSTDGRSLKANRALALNNMKLGAEIAVALLKAD
jgi:pseudouridine-5'-phosphate glycosidase